MTISGGPSSEFRAPDYPPPGQPRRRRRILALTTIGVVVAVALAVGGWWQFVRAKPVAITLDGVAVDQPAQVLRAAEADLARLARSRHGAAGAATHCYFQRAEHSRRLSDVGHDLRCGPVLFYDGNPTRSYLTYSLDRTGTARGRAVLSVGANPASDEPAAIPSGAILVRPDRIRPPSGSGGLLAPIPPAAATDVLLAVDSVGPNAPRKVSAGAIIGSDNVSVTLLSSGWVAHYGRDAGIRSAAAGQKLLAFEVSFGEGENATPKFGKLKVGVSVDNGTPRPLPLGHTALASAQRFVVGVPTASRAVDLALTDSGVTQRLSILTGKPSTSNVAVLRRADRSVRINASGTATAHVNAGGTPFDAHLTLHAYSAYLGYFLPSRHAHLRSPDKAFLQIDVCYQSADFVDAKTCHGFRSTDQSLALTGGGVIAARDLDPRSNDSSTIVFEVPATFTSGTLRISGSESSGDGWSMTVVQPYSLKITIPG